MDELDIILASLCLMLSYTIIMMQFDRWTRGLETRALWTCSLYKISTKCPD